MNFLEVLVSQCKSELKTYKEHLHRLTAPDENSLSGQLTIPPGQKGWSYVRLFGQHLLGACSIHVNDPYIRLPYQIQNLSVLLDLIRDLGPVDRSVRVLLNTYSDDDTSLKQSRQLNQIVKSFESTRLAFSWRLDSNPHFHARSIVTDTGWRIALDRGIDLFQRPPAGSRLNTKEAQENALSRGSEIMYIRYR